MRPSIPHGSAAAANSLAERLLANPRSNPAPSPAKHSRACTRAPAAARRASFSSTELRMRRMREVVHRRAERLARPEDVGLGDRRRAAPALGEEVPAKERARGGLHHEAVLPAVRQVRAVAVWLAAGTACGAAARNLLRETHSSASEWENAA
jgi:hypothetical protein